MRNVPGTRALAFASRWFDPAIVHRTFEPLIADWQREWYDSAPSRRPWVSMCASIAFLCAAALSSPSVIATSMPSSMSRRVAMRIAGFCLGIGGVLTILLLRSMGGREMEPPLWADLMLMAGPAALAISFPFAMVLAADAIRGEAGVAPHVARAAALKVGAFAVCFMLLLIGIVGPVASRQYTAITTPDDWNLPEPAIQQLSTIALLAHPERNAPILAVPQYTRAGMIRRELLQRSMMTVMPAIFLWLRWSALARPRRRFWPLPGWAMTGLVIVAFFGTVVGGFRIEMAFAWMPGNGVFVPLLVFGTWALVEHHRAGAGGAAPQEA